MYMNVFPMHTHASSMHPWCHEGQKRVLCPLEMEL